MVFSALIRVRRGRYLVRKRSLILTFNQYSWRFAGDTVEVVSNQPFFREVLQTLVNSVNLTSFLISLSFRFFVCKMETPGFGVSVKWDQ